jgi:membrane-anchored protein YejM (alkaline phosphatase superfamily)
MILLLIKFTDFLLITALCLSASKESVNVINFEAMVSKMDESVGRVVEALQNKRMLNNSIIVFISDNGAPSVGVFQNWGSNYPLRGVSVLLPAVFELMTPFVRSADPVMDLAVRSK